MVFVAQSEYEHWDPLPEVPDAVTEFMEALRGSPYEFHLPQLLAGGSKGEVESALAAWLRGLSATDRLVVYWIGHGTGNGGLYLVTRDSPRADLTAAVALRADVLGEMIAKSPAAKVVIILDTCYSSMGAQGIAATVHETLNTRMALPGQERFVAVIPSASALVKAQEGVCCRALRRLLIDPDWTDRPWSDHDECIPVGDLSDALMACLKEEFGPAWQPPTPAYTGIGQRFLPNPRFRDAQPTMDVETRRHLVKLPEALTLAARGIEVGDGGWYFVGRERVLADIVNWLENSPGGLLLVTGPPGSGKSAVIGRVVTLSDPAYREQMRAAGGLEGTAERTLPPKGLVQAAVHAKGMNTADVGRSIVDNLGVDIPREVPVNASSVVQAVNGLTARVTIVVDALDEAADPRGIASLLRNLADEAKCRVLVGTRRSPEGRTIRAGEHRHRDLRVLFGNEARIIDLEDEADTQRDITSYVVLRLKDSRHREDPQGIARVARAVAEKAEGVFLYARVVARGLQDAPRLDAPLPDSAIDAFVADLEMRFGDRRTLVDELLAALAWGEGAGLSRRVWAPVATALSGTRSIYQDHDVTWLLDHAGWHILEAGEAGQTVYRLAHQAFADHYKARIDDPLAAQRAITGELVGWTKK